MRGYDPISDRYIDTDNGIDVGADELKLFSRDELARQRREAMTTGDAVMQIVDEGFARAEQAERDRHAAIDRAMQGWTPSGDKLVLAVVRVLERKVGSVIAPGHDSPMGDKVERRGRLARVVAAGPDASIAVNARVYCGSYAGAVIEIEGHSLLVLSESEVLMTEGACANG